MATSKLNNYSALDNNITEMQLTEDASFVSNHTVSLTGWATTAAPAIAAGSKIEINGAFYQVDTDESISGSPSDGNVYIVCTPGASSFTAAFTNTAPTWSDSKQGFYGTGAGANNRYLEYLLVKSGASYTKYQFPGLMNQRMYVNSITASAANITTASITTASITTASITTASITTASITTANITTGNITNLTASGISIFGNPPRSYDDMFLGATITGAWLYFKNVNITIPVGNTSGYVAHGLSIYATIYMVSHTVNGNAHMGSAIYNWDATNIYISSVDAGTYVIRIIYTV